MSEKSNYNISAAGSEINRGQYFRIPPNETGWDRVKMMYTDRGGRGISNSNPEMQFITESVTSAFFTGGILGAMLCNRAAREEFIRKNKATTYTSMYDAKRKYYDKIILDMMRSGWSWGWRMGLFCGSYMTIVTTIAVYRNKVGIREHVLAGTLVGGCWKLNMGLRATLVGGIVGGTLGTVMGTIVTGSFWLMGITLADMRYWSHDYWEQQLRQREEEMKMAKQSRESPKWQQDTSTTHDGS